MLGLRTAVVLLAAALVSVTSQSFGESTEVSPSNLLKNEELGGLEDRVPTGWQLSGGASLARSASELAPASTVELVSGGLQSDSLLNQDASYLIQGILPGDLVHWELNMSCKVEGEVFLELMLGYEAGEAKRWRPLRVACPADGKMHRVSVDWLVTEDDLKGLQLISFGVRVLQGTSTSVLLAQPRAWLANAGFE